MPKKHDPRTDLGREIRATRERLRYSQDALGELLSVSGTIISRWETGKYQPPIESLARLADLAGSTEAERDTIYSHWVGLAGYREPRLSAPPREAAAGSIPTTTEGAMAQAVIDQVQDPEVRLRLVLRLREWAQQWPEDAADTARVQDPEQSRTTAPASSGAAASAENPP